MVPLRIMIVDDDVISRKLLRTVLEREEDFEVVGVAASPNSAVDKIARLAPDLVTLDLEMARKDGMNALTRMRARWPELPVIVFNSPSEEGAEATLEALAAGASDFVTKPCECADGGLPLEPLQDSFLPRIRALCGRDSSLGVTTFRERPVLERSRDSSPTPVTERERRDVLAIGVSTGGPAVLRELLPRLDPRTPVPVVLVQHMSSMFIERLVERLARVSALPVKVAEAGEALEPGHVYVAPGGHHMTLERNGASVEIRLDQEPPENSCRPAADPLFRSVATVYESRALGLVLTGMGRDGLEGAKCIKEGGGEVIVQDQATSVVWGMPGAIARRGLADAVLPVEEIASEINARLRHGRSDTPNQAQAG